VVEDEEEPGMAADGSRKVVFQDLSVQVKDGEVRTIGITWKWSRQLGPLAGALAGVADDNELSATHKVVSEVLGTSPRTGTIFVSFANGERFETPLRKPGQEQLDSLDDAIEKFNALAKSASG
jgi:hypothetical protein